MVKENFFLIFDQYMMVIIIMGKKMEKVYIIKIMELSILVIFMMGKFMVVEKLKIIILFINVLGKMVLLLKLL